jgi:small-conductance mechanosensitive channel
MDEACRQALKWKFTRLTLLLNIIVLLVAAAVIAAFRLPPGINLPIAAMLAAAAVGLAIYFMRNYRTTKEWLEKNT